MRTYILYVYICFMSWSQCASKTFLNVLFVRKTSKANNSERIDEGMSREAGHRQPETLLAPSRQVYVSKAVGLRI